MKIISLTLKNGSVVYVNTAHITAFWESSKTTFVFETSGTDPWEVRETPEQIIELIKLL